MKPILEMAKKAAERIKSERGVIHLVSHFDADGISSAAIMTSVLMKMGKRFYVTIVKHITHEIVSGIIEKGCPLVVFTDIGSSYIDEIEKIEKDIIIIDHHEIKKVWMKQNMLHVNPELFKDHNMSGACVSYMVAKELTGSDELAPLALIGATGDSTFPDLSMFENHDKIVRSRGLKLFGRFSRPVHKALEMCYDPEIPGISGSESAALQFLAELGIDIRSENGFKTVGDLSQDEMQKLASAIIKEHMEHNSKFEIGDIFGDVWTLTDFQDELKDAMEFATMLNCCGRLDEAAVGVELCLGSRAALERVRSLIKSYRRKISVYLKWVNENGDRMKRTENAKYILARDAIHENFIGTIVSIYQRSSKSALPIIGMADSEMGVKISARSNDDININEIVSKAAVLVGGTGGGHCKASGATIPKSKENDFVDECENQFRMRVSKHL